MQFPVGGNLRIGNKLDKYISIWQNFEEKDIYKKKKKKKKREKKLILRILLFKPKLYFQVHSTQKA